MRLAIHTPADFQRGPLFVASILRSLHRADPLKLPVTLELGPIGRHVGLIAEVPPDLKAVFLSQLADACPGVRVEALEDTPRIDACSIGLCQSLRLTPDVNTLATQTEFEDRLDRVRADPLSAILSALRPTEGRRITTRVRLTLKPASRRRIRHAQRIRDVLTRCSPGSRLTDMWRHCCTSDRHHHRLFGELLRLFFGSVFLNRTPHTSSEDETKLNGLLFESWLTVEVFAHRSARQPATSRIRELTGAFGQVASSDTRFEADPIRAFPLRKRRRGFLLSPEEIAILWHPPTAEVRATRLSRNRLSEIEPPVCLPCSRLESDVTELGRVRFRRRKDRFGIRIDDRRRHIFLCGKTGMGKSTLLQRMLLSDMHHGRGVCLIDPHGDLVESLLPCIPKRRSNDVVVFDAAEDRPLTLNPLAVPAGSDPVLVAESVLTVFEHVFGLSESASPRLLHILRNCLLTLVETPDATLLSINRLLLDDGFRRSISGRISNPVVQQFWLEEFSRWKPADRTAFIASLQNKLGAFLTNPQLQQILGHPGGSVRLRKIMDDEKILLVNLSKGRLGESPSRLLGSLLVSSLQTAAMSRAGIPETDRRDFFVSVDEFQNFSTPSFAVQLSESRKYRVSLTLANQFLDQIDPITLAAVFGNVGSLISFQVGPTDAETLAVQFGGEATSDGLLNLPRFHACTRLLIDGEPALPFLMTTLPPESGDETIRERVLRSSSRRVGRRDK